MIYHFTTMHAKEYRSLLPVIAFLFTSATSSQHHHHHHNDGHTPCSIIPEHSHTNPFARSCNNHICSDSLMCIRESINNNANCEFMFPNELPFLNEIRQDSGYTWLRSEHFNQVRWIRADTADCSCCNFHVHTDSPTTTRKTTLSTTAMPTSGIHTGNPRCAQADSEGCGLNGNYFYACSFTDWAKTTCPHFCGYCAGVQIVMNPSSAHAKPQSDGLLVLQNGVWGYACASGWTHKNSEVVCHMAGLYSKSVYHTDVTPDPQYQITMSGVSCTGSESNLADCNHDGSGQTTCPGNLAVKVQCEKADFEVALVSTFGIPNHGELIIKHNGIWTKICAVGWLPQNNEVICRMAGFQTTGVVSHAEKVTNVFATNFNHFMCNGTEQTLTDCPFQSFYTYHGCPDGKYIVMQCGDPLTTISTTTTLKPTTISMTTTTTLSTAMQMSSTTAAPSSAPPIIPVRLVGGSGYFDGRVEVLVNGHWGTVCGDNWSLNNARVVCSFLGYNPNDARYHTEYHVGSSAILLDSVQCAGTEVQLGECRLSATSSNNCYVHEDIIVSCKKDPTTTTTTKSAGPSTTAVWVPVINLSTTPTTKASRPLTTAAWIPVG